MGLFFFLFKKWKEKKLKTWVHINVDKSLLLMGREFRDGYRKKKKMKSERKNLVVNGLSHSQLYMKVYSEIVCIYRFMCIELPFTPHHDIPYPASYLLEFIVYKWLFNIYLFN